MEKSKCFYEKNTPCNSIVQYVNYNEGVSACLNSIGRAKELFKYGERKVGIKGVLDEDFSSKRKAVSKDEFFKYSYFASNSDEEFFLSDKTENMDFKSLEEGNKSELHEENLLLPNSEMIRHFDNGQETSLSCKECAQVELGKNEEGEFERKDAFDVKGSFAGNVVNPKCSVLADCSYRAKGLSQKPTRIVGLKNKIYNESNTSIRGQKETISESKKRKSNYKNKVNNSNDKRYRLFSVVPQMNAISHDFAERKTENLEFFGKTLRHMKYREFLRSHNGLIGNFNSLDTLGWMIFVLTVFIINICLFCLKDEREAGFGYDSFDLNKFEGRLITYSYLSMCLTCTLCLKYGRPTSFKYSIFLCKLMLFLLFIVNPSIQILGNGRTCRLTQDSYKNVWLRLISFCDGWWVAAFTQIQLALFSFNALKTCSWPALWKLWLRSKYFNQWKITRKQYEMFTLPLSPEVENLMKKKAKHPKSSWQHSLSSASCNLGSPPADFRTAQHSSRNAAAAKGERACGFRKAHAALQVRRKRKISKSTASFKKKYTHFDDPADPADPKRLLCGENANDKRESRVKNSTGCYLEAQGENFLFYIFRKTLNFFLHKKLHINQKVTTAWYIGEVDAFERPHGFGYWRCDTSHGEALVGHWENGIPIGPFKSRHFGTGSGFICIRIGWVIAFLEPQRLEYGVSGVECCVSGAFFRTFPHVTHFPKSLETPQKNKLNALFSSFNPKDNLDKDASNLKRETPASKNYAMLYSTRHRAKHDKPKNDLNIERANRASLDVSGAFGKSKKKSNVNVWFSDNLSEEAKNLELSRDMLNTSETKSSNAMSKSSRSSIFSNVTKTFLRQKNNNFSDLKIQRKHLMISILEGMCPHLPNFGIFQNCELHISVGAERGLYIAGWLPKIDYSRYSNEAKETGKFSDKRINDITKFVKNLKQKNEEIYHLSKLASSNTVKNNLFFHGGRKIKGLYHKEIKKVVAIHRCLKIVLKHLGLYHKKKKCYKQMKSFYRRMNDTKRTNDINSKTLTIKVVQKKLPFIDKTLQLKSWMDSPKSKKENSTQKEMAQSEERYFFSDDPVDTEDDVCKIKNDYKNFLSWVDNRPELKVHNWVCAEIAGTSEAWIFCHGYNTNLTQSLKILAQMASFGNFPTYIKPLVFSWPAGNNFLEFFKAQEASKNSKTHECFKQFLISLRDAGIREVHIMAHSLGSRMLLMSIRKIIAEENLFCPIDNSINSKQDIKNENNLSISKQLKIVTLIFLNPEYYLADFVSSEYPLLRRYCSHISLFCDSLDGALRWAETFSGRQSLGRAVFGLYTCLSKESEKFDKIITINENSEESQKKQADTLSSKNIFAKATDSLIFFSGYGPKNLKCNTIEWLDVDVIDTTWLGSNVHKLRHSYWSLNREIIEDIRELIVSRKRAFQRISRLDRRKGNVWVYRVAPSNLTSIFESTV